MGQSELLAGALVGGFVLYLAMNNRLAAYWTLMTGGSSPSSASGGGSATPPPATTATAAGTAGAAVAQVAAGLVPTPASIGDFLGQAAASGFGGGF